MTLEIARRLIGGTWRTGVASESGGGGSPPAVTDGTTSVDATTIRATAVSEPSPGEAEIIALPDGMTFDEGDGYVALDGNSSNGFKWPNTNVGASGPFLKLDSGGVRVRADSGRLALTNTDGDCDVLAAQAGIGTVIVVGNGQQLYVFDPEQNIQYFGVDASGNVLLPNLPIEDPLVPGALWNNGGVLTISDGP